ncbi:ribulokinase [uncultured Brachyspira sp.]|uniref:ribulokinase n=1 Tax=uncultured Brachyspira sp. TaxID=221953 RepID=UPI00259B267B|nr:ribulokinase [uncultured Brachyspira sp.]
MKKFNANEHFTLGADFGSDSVRVVILDASNGKVAGSYVSYYKRWEKKLYCNDKINQFRQHPLDYIESLTEAVNKSLEEANKTCKDIKERIRGICIDTTGSTPCLCDKDGMPLSMSEEFKEDPDAMFILWKDHTSVREAEEINRVAHSNDVDYTKYLGGVYSTEWFWAKALHTIRKNKKVKEKVWTVIEHCDWITALLCGNTNPNTIKRSRCAAGHKCMWHKSWNGYPPREFFDKFDSKLGDIRETLGNETYSTETIEGYLTKEWVNKLGLKENILVCVGAYDSHIGAVGGLVDVGVLVKSIGTSTCDVTIGNLPKKGETEKAVKGICGQVDGSVLDGYIGYEAGQSAYGDYYSWFRNLLTWTYKNMSKNTEEENEIFEKKILPELEKEASKIITTEDSPVATDWINGRRTPFANQNLKATIFGMYLGIDAPMFMKMLLESTAYGAKAIIECFEDGGIEIKKVMAIGGVARKSKLGMQILADVTNREIYVTKDDQAPAIGAAVFAAKAYGLYENVFEAQKSISAGIERVHKPIKENVKIYEKLYKKYKEIGNFTENIINNF